MSLGEFQSWSVVFDTEYIANQKMVQINAFELSFNLQYQPTLYIAWFSCNLQKFVADFREITPNRANAWCSALWGQLPLTGFHEVHAFCLSFLLFKQLQKLLYDTLEWGRETKHKKRKKKSHETCQSHGTSCWSHGLFYIMGLNSLILSSNDLLIWHGDGFTKLRLTAVFSCRLSSFYFVVIKLTLENPLWQK